jgi:hypothetical protein
MTKQQIADLISINLISGSKIPALKHREVEYALLDAIFSVGFVTGDIKEVDCTNQYIIDNFEANGLGKNERTGWAICNGNNGTTDRNGRVSMPYGSGYLTMRTLGGSADAVLVSHSHPNSLFNPANGSGFIYNFDSVGDKEHYGQKATETVGETATNKNLQPYIVTLFIQKI